MHTYYLPDVDLGPGTQSQTKHVAYILYKCVESDNDQRSNAYTKIMSDRKHWDKTETETDLKNTCGGEQKGQGGQAKPG